MVITTPYRENSVVSIARSASKHQCLGEFYTTLYFGRWLSACDTLVGRRVAGELERRGYPGIPETNIRSAGMWAEILHVTVRRLFGIPSSVSWMYVAKERFDRGVSGKASSEERIVVGMYDAALHTFIEFKNRGGMAVLNFVNSHPAEQNRILNVEAGVEDGHHELIPKDVASRVEKELKLADLVLVPSRFVERQLLERGVSPDKIAVIPYGVNLQAFSPGPQHHASSDTVECLYVGQISHRKGVHVLLQAAAQLKDKAVHFRLIGPLVSSEVLRSLPLNVTYEGASHPGGVPDAMRNADMFVLPTLEDACALVTFEAMASGLPLITTRRNGASEQLRDGEDALIVPAADVDALVAAIEALVESPELRSSLGDAARLKVESAYSWEEYGERVLAAIDARRQVIGIQAY